MRQISTESRKCPVCPNAEATTLGTLPSPDRLTKCLSEYDLLECQNCRLVYLSPLPGQEALDEIYLESGQFIGCSDYEGERAELATEFYVSRLSAMMDSLKVGERPFRVLEVGAGLAWVSRAAKELGNCFTAAQDITSECENACEWVDEYIVGEVEKEIGTIEKFGPYDVVSLTHVIEHLSFPIECLRTLLPQIGTSGLILVTAPHRPTGWFPSKNMQSWREWAYNHVPSHLQYFDRNSMGKLCNVLGLELAFWDDTAEEGQAFEAWLRPLP